MHYYCTQDDLNVQDFFDAPKSVLLHAITHITNKYGSVEQYLYKNGFGPADVARMRTAF